jgi:ribosomal protein L11 methyltransferase
MPWVSVTIAVPAALVEPLEAGFEEWGAAAVTASDAGDVPILEPAPDAQPLWPDVRLEALFASDADVDAIRGALLQWFMDHGRHMPEPEIAMIADQDWSSTWREGLEPQRYHDRLVVVSRDLSWPADDRVAVLRLDPGLAFGTGTHPTTALCLEWLAAAELEGLDVIDYGCGSGILGIAAILLGAASVIAVDHDPQALAATRDNAAFNGIAASQCVTHTPATLPADLGGRDLVVANILSRPLVALAPRLTRMLERGGRMLLSGILEDQLATVLAAYPDVRFGAAAVRDGWVCVAGTVTGIPGEQHGHA